MHKSLCSLKGSLNSHHLILTLHTSVGCSILQHHFVPDRAQTSDFNLDNISML